MKPKLNPQRGPQRTPPQMGPTSNTSTPTPLINRLQTHLKWTPIGPQNEPQNGPLNKQPTNCQEFNILELIQKKNSSKQIHAWTRSWHLKKYDYLSWKSQVQYNH